MLFNNIFVYENLKIFLKINFKYFYKVENINIQIIYEIQFILLYHFIIIPIKRFKFNFKI